MNDRQKNGDGSPKPSPKDTRNLTPSVNTPCGVFVSNSILPQASSHRNGAPLGRNTNYVTPPQYQAQRANRERLLPLAGKLLPGERVGSCGRWVNVGSEGVSVHLSEKADGARAGFGGLAVCGSVWMCPVCSAKINAARRVELATAMETARLDKRGVYLVTFTIQHSALDSLSDTMEAVKEAWRRVKAGAPWQRLTAETGIMGHITATEATHGANGWHPHLHVLIFTYSKLTPYGLQRFTDKLTARYVKMVSKSGSYASAIHSVDVRDGRAAGDYVTKWGLENELTGQASKNGDGAHSGFTPFQLLARYGDGDGRAGKLFVEWALTMKGRRQLVWSKGLRELLAVKDSGEDDTIAAVADGAPLAVITREQWDAIITNHLKLRVLEAIENARSVKPLWDTLEALGLPHTDLNNAMLVRLAWRSDVADAIADNEAALFAAQRQHTGLGLQLREAETAISEGYYQDVG